MRLTMQINTPSRIAYPLLYNSKYIVKACYCLCLNRQTTPTMLVVMETCNQWKVNNTNRHGVPVYDYNHLYWSENQFSINSCYYFFSNEFFFDRIILIYVSTT